MTRESVDLDAIELPAIVNRNRPIGRPPSCPLAPQR
jgi:hypothetical protein